MMVEIIPNWHPVFVHFTLALYTAACFLIMLGSLVRTPMGELALHAGYMNLWLGCLFTFGTVAAGVYAYNTVFHDGPSHRAMTDHRNWALGTATLFLLLTLWSLRLFKRGRKRDKKFMAVLLIATVLLATSGWKGAEVVYRHGVGVMSMPDMDSHHHTISEVPPGVHHEMHHHSSEGH